MDKLKALQANKSRDRIQAYSNVEFTAQKRVWVNHLKAFKPF
jgi:hypothetical protein